MKDIALTSKDGKELYVVPEKHILEVVENEDGSSTLAIVEIIQTATPVEEIRKQLSEKHCKRIKWIRKGE